MADLTWMRRHENIHQIETVHEINSQGKENHIIILPEEIKMPFAINHYIAQSNYTISNISIGITMEFWIDFLITKII